MTIRSLLTFSFVAIFLCAFSVGAQTSAFTQQGQLNVAGNPANGNFDFEFRLFDAASGGAQQGVTVVRPSVAVANGIYAVTLDFGAATFTTGDRFLDISVRPSGGGAFTQLTPRQPINSTPYAIRSISAVNANNALNAVNLTGPLAGDVTGTQSATTIAPNAVTNAKIANNAVTGAKIAGSEVVKSINTLQDNVTLAAGSNITITPSGNTLTISSTGGGGGGILNQSTLQTGANFNIDGTGTANILSAAQYNIGGNRVMSFGGSSTLIGISTGTSGVSNVFVGIRAGQSSTGSNNAFFGADAGKVSSGGSNSFFGTSSGFSNSDGFGNSFFGVQSGSSTTSGYNNVFIGLGSGQTNTTGSSNTVIGKDSDVGANNLTFATAIGAGAIAETSNRVQLGRDGLDTVRIGNLGAATGTNLCIRPDNILAACTSSGRYKKNVQPLGASLNLVQKLRPVTFEWKDRDEPDLGLIAEEVAKIDPLLVTRNRNGEIQGVKYDQVSVVLINAVKEQQQTIMSQQAQIEDQSSKIKAQESRIDALTRLVCSSNKDADICREK